MHEVIRRNRHQLKFVHVCVGCGTIFRVIDKTGKEIYTTQDERDLLEEKIDNVHYTDSHGICDGCMATIDAREMIAIIMERVN